MAHNFSSVQKDPPLLTFFLLSKLKSQIKCQLLCKALAGGPALLPAIFPGAVSLLILPAALLSCLLPFLHLPFLLQ